MRAQIKTPQESELKELQTYDLIGFGSGIYGAQHHKTVLDFVDKLPQDTNMKAFIFSTIRAFVRFSIELSPAHTVTFSMVLIVEQYFIFVK